MKTKILFFALLISCKVYAAEQRPEIFTLAQMRALLVMAQATDNLAEKTERVVFDLNRRITDLENAIYMIPALVASAVEENRRNALDMSRRITALEEDKNYSMQGAIQRLSQEIEHMKLHQLAEIPALQSNIFEILTEQEELKTRMQRSEERLGVHDGSLQALKDLFEKAIIRVDGEIKELQIKISSQESV